MTKNDYIEKITQTLEHLTKDELKDVSILTTAQLGVRSKFDERQQLEHEIANLTPQLQQKALPVVPECVGEWIEKDKNYGRSVYDGLHRLDYEAGEIAPREVAKWVFDNKKNLNLFTRAWLDGYTVEKPQLFYLKNKLTTSYLALDINTGYYEHWGEEIIPKLLNKQGYKSSFTKQEIDSMQTGSYEQIEVVS